MTRDEALRLIKEHISNKNLIKHMLATEACMRKLASYFKEDEERWGLVGLLHDLDYEETIKTLEKHGLLTCEFLRERGFSEEELLAIKAHAEKAECQGKMAEALYSVDPLTGLIVAAALMHPEKKLKKVNRDFILRRYKEKNFAKGANRQQIAQCEKLGITLGDFIEICLSAMQEIAEDLGL
jgi:putative nucleotidyltransferase with HDIG domain